MSRELEEALDESLSLLEQGQGVEECLARYPGLREELEPLVRVAARGRGALGAPLPSPQARAVARARLLSSLPQPQPHRWAFLPRGLALALSSLLAVVLLSGGVLAASWGSLPGEALYGVKEAAERARLGLTPTPQGKARYLLQLAEKRMAEVQALEERGDIGRTELPRQRLGGHLGGVRGAVAQMEPEAAEQVVVFMQVRRARHQGRLLELRGRVPGPPPFKGHPPAAAPAPMATPVPTPSPAPSLFATPEGKEPPAPVGAPGPEGPADQASRAGKTDQAPPEVTPTPPPPFYGLAAAVEDYEQAFQELLKEIEKKPHPPRPRRKG